MLITDFHDNKINYIGFVRLDHVLVQFNFQIDLEVLTVDIQRDRLAF